MRSATGLRAPARAGAVSRVARAAGLPGRVSFGRGVGWVMARAADKHALFYAELAKAFAGEKTPAAAMRAVAREISPLETCSQG